MTAAPKTSVQDLQTEIAERDQKIIYLSVDHSNLYQYVFNNPFRYQDPNGESVGGYLLGLGEIVLGGAIIAGGFALEVTPISVCIFAVHNSRFIWMQLEFAFLQSACQRVFNHDSLLLYQKQSCKTGLY